VNRPHEQTDPLADADGPVDAYDAVVVGAGIAGLCAARALVGAGRRILVLDKGRGVGGRMATRRLAGAVADHGAQFFRARGPAFGALLAAAHAAGAVTPWQPAHPERPSGDDAFGEDSGGALPVWMGTRGMTAPAKWLSETLAEAGVEIRTSSRVEGIGSAGRRVVVRMEDGPALAAGGVVLSPPVPQTIELLADGGLEERLLPGTHERLKAVSYEPCISLLLVLDRPSLVPPPGAIRFDGRREGFPLAWIADNLLKGISQVPCLTLHATGAFSRDRFDSPQDRVSDELVEAARPWIDCGRAGPVGHIVERSWHRWKYARVARGCEELFLPVHEGPPVVLCGDAFGGPGVEGAADSGLAAGRWLADRLGSGGIG